MFCNICKHGVRSKHFACIFVCYSWEARNLEQLEFPGVKCSLLFLLKFNVFVCVKVRQQASSDRKKKNSWWIVYWHCARNSQRILWNGAHVFSCCFPCCLFQESTTFLLSNCKILHLWKKIQGPSSSLNSDYFTVTSILKKCCSRNLFQHERIFFQSGKFDETIFQLRSRFSFCNCLKVKKVESFSFEKPRKCKRQHFWCWLKNFFKVLRLTSRLRGLHAFAQEAIKMLPSKLSWATQLTILWFRGRSWCFPRIFRCNFCS